MRLLVALLNSLGTLVHEVAHYLVLRALKYNVEGVKAYVGCSYRSNVRGHKLGALVVLLPWEEGYESRGGVYPVYLEILPRWQKRLVRLSGRAGQVVLHLSLGALLGLCIKAPLVELVLLVNVPLLALEVTAGVLVAALAVVLVKTMVEGYKAELKNKD